MKENREVTDTNVGDIEEAVKTMEHWVEYEKNNKDKINKADELIYIQETILSDYKRILKINEVLLKENEEYSKQLDLDYVDKNYIPKQKIKAKIEELNKTINKGGIIYSLKQCARCQKDVLEKLLIEESED